MIFVGDIGVSITIQIYSGSTPFNITNVDDIELTFVKPNGTSITKKKSLGEVIVVDYINGIVSYTTPQGFLDVSGTWIVLVKVVEVRGSKEYKCTQAKFNVEEQI